METKVFEKIGLASSEIEIYLMLLKIGPNTAARIAEKTNLNRSHIYDSLKKLIEKGFVSTYESNKTLHFNAASPETIKDYIQDMEAEVNKMLPELNRIKEAEKPNAKVKLFQGKNGLKTVLQDILRTRKDYVVFGEEGQFQEVFPIYIQQFLRDIKQLGIKERLLSKAGVKIPLTKNTQVRYLDAKFFSPATTAVYGSKVAILIWSDPYNATVIEDKDVADSYRNYFESLWSIGKK